MNSPLTAPDWSSCVTTWSMSSGGVPRQLELELSKLRGRLPGAVDDLDRVVDQLGGGPPIRVQYVTDVPGRAQRDDWMHQTVSHDCADKIEQLRRRCLRFSGIERQSQLRPEPLPRLPAP